MQSATTTNRGAITNDVRKITKDIADVTSKMSSDITVVIVAANVATQILTAIIAIVRLSGETVSPLNLGILLGVWIVALIITAYGNIRYLKLIKTLNPKQIDKVMEYYKRRVRKCDNSYRKSHAQRTALHFSNEAMWQLVQEPNDNLSDDISKLLDPLVLLHEDAFGFREKELCNFTLFVYNPNTEKLEIKWRRINEERLIDLEQERLDRDFSPDQGYVGGSFRMGKPWIVPNVENVDRDGLIEDDYRDRDLLLYPSFMSIPVRYLATDSTATAILIITSSRVNHFVAEEFDHLCSAYQSILCTYFLQRRLTRSRTAQ